MTPKEKAKELFDNFDFIYSYDGLNIMDDEFTKDDRKQCALIVVDEIIFSHIIDGIIDYEIEIYWDNVKQEIENL